MAVTFIENDKNEFVDVLNQVVLMKTLSNGEVKNTLHSLEDAIQSYLKDDIDGALKELQNSTTLLDLLPKDNDLYDYLYEIKMIIYELYVKIYVDSYPGKAIGYLDLIEKQICTPKKTMTTEKLDYRHTISYYYYRGIAFKNINDSYNARACYAVVTTTLLKDLTRKGWIADLDICLRLYYVAGKSFVGIDDGISEYLFKAALQLFHKYYVNNRTKVRKLIITKNTCQLCIANGEALLGLFKKHGLMKDASELEYDIKYLYNLLNKIQL